MLIQLEDHEQFNENETKEEKLAELFHVTYERLAPDFGYKTREASAKPWADVPEQNKNLMIAVCKEIITSYEWTESHASEVVHKFKQRLSEMQAELDQWKPRTESDFSVMSSKRGC